MESISVKKVVDNKTMEEMIAIQIVIRYLDIIGQNTNFFGKLDEWAKETRSFVSTFLSFRQFYQNQSN